MSLHLFNTMSRGKELFTPRDPSQVGLYVCGVTVYDYCHIGHARVMVVFDMVVRHMRAMGYPVRYVRNFTDIDDKIIRRAAELGEDIGTLTGRFIDAFHQDMAALGVTPADVEPCATAHLPEMQAMIQRLLDNGLAYESAGDIYFAVDKLAGYGRLSGKELEEQLAGARVAVGERKNNPLDFVLWKGAKPEEPQWSSPWGAGRPGWHIECSAMSTRYLGESFDIHGGGRDLIFPHHENEIAQTEGATGHPWVNYWMHVGFVNVVSEEGEREKMSKSLGNFHTIRDLLERYPGEVLRLFILNSHYRTPLDFSWSLLDAAWAGLDRLYTALGVVAEQGALPEVQVITPDTLASMPLWQEEGSHFYRAMNDDFNSSQAMASLFEIARKINRFASENQWSEAREGAVVLRGLAAILGLCTMAPQDWFQQARPGELSAGEIEGLIQARTQARKNRDFAEADRIRNHLTEQGVTLLDSREGTTWRRSR
ncbi:MAG: cysteine--tRNA ligase [Magnetococcales bacterium]|nr:cysteine--tRNA ligase [Magnetococcales bacterium]NGZ26777.1 cysteine--tRNA ligase [Magnetococcales bacterium]